MAPGAETPDPSLPPPTVPAAAYDERYFLGSCAGHPEWVESGGAAAANRYGGSLDLARLTPGDVLVDIGTGRGELLAVAVERGAARAIGIEYAPAATALASRTLAARGVEDRTELIQADARAIPLPDAVADVVTLLDVVEHLGPAELDRTLAEAHRLLRPGGRLLVHTLPNRSIYAITYRLQRDLRPRRRRRWPRDPRRDVERELHINEQSVGSLRRALKRAGFSGARVRTGAGIYTDFVPDEGARDLYRKLAPWPLLGRLGAADVWAQAVKGGRRVGTTLPAPPRRAASRGRARAARWPRCTQATARAARRRLGAALRGKRRRSEGARAIEQPAAPAQPAAGRSGGPQLFVRGHSLALGAGASDQGRSRFTRLVADRLGLEEVNLAVGGAIAHWSTYGDVGDGGYPLVLRGGLPGGQTGEAAPGSAAHLPPGSAALLFYGINDVAALGSRMRPYQEALRTILSRTRAQAVFEAEDRAGLELSPGWEDVTGVDDRNSGSAYLRAERDGVSADITLPDTFAGGAVAIGFVAEPDEAARVGCRVDGSSQIEGRAIPALDVDGAAVCSGDRANGVVLRLAGLPAGTRSIELTATEVSGGIQFDYWQVEADPAPLVLLLEQYRLMQYELYRGWPADPVTDDHILEVLNPATRAVAAEFDSSVLLVDTDGALEKDYTVDHASYPDDEGHQRLADHVLRQVEPRVRDRA